MTVEGIAFQIVTLLLLVISESLPFTSGPTNGLLHWLLRFLKATQTAISEPTTAEAAPAPRELKWGFLNKK
jgi:hypothetical protein